MVIYLGIFLVALSLSLLTVPLVCNWAVASGRLDEPDHRKVHTRSVPRLGGVAIFAGFSLAILLAGEFSPIILSIYAGATILFATGLIDDFVGLSARQKFLGEILGAVVTIHFGDLYIYHLGDLFGTGSILLPFWLAFPFTLFAVVGVINAINLIDGLDGLAGGISLIALAAFMVLGVSAGNWEVVLLCLALAGGVLGFLRHNAFPAKIFMGDVGSLVVGFVLAFVAVHLSQAEGSPVQSAVPLLILGIPVADTVRVMGSRLLNGINPFTPDMNHIHHRLLDLGFSHRVAVVILYAGSLFWAVTAILLQYQPAWLLLLLFLLVSILGYCTMTVSSVQFRFPLLRPVSVVKIDKRVAQLYGTLFTSILALWFKNLS